MLELQGMPIIGLRWSYM